jgi:cyclic pyranopterin phosphate synthase
VSPLAAPPLDRLSRPLHDLRVSVTDRCNLRCVYCMPKEVFGPGFAFLPHADILTFEEIDRVVRAGVALGVRKVRLTGGEPLLRRDLPKLVAMIDAIPGLEDLTLTTNGVLLPRHARALAEAGLRRVTVSLDALDEAVFSAMNGGEATVAQVLEGIAAAEAAGLSPIKVNMVVERGRNLHQVLPMVERFRGTGHVLRFIEYMDVGTTNGWRLDDVVSAREILDLVSSRHELEAIDPNYRGEVAERWRFRDGGGEIGLISSVTQPFCGDCHRARLSAKGELFTCLFAESGFDLRAILRGGGDDEVLRRSLETLWTARTDRYSEIRSSLTVLPKRVEMSHIGG